MERKYSRRDAVKTGLLYGSAAAGFVSLGYVQGALDAAYLTIAQFAKRKSESSPELEELKKASEARQRASAAGEFKISLPKWTADEKVRIEFFKPPISPSQGALLLIELPDPYPKNELLFPAMVQGRIVELNDFGEHQQLWIKDRNQIWEINYKGKALVELGQDVSLGYPVVKLYLNSPERLGEPFRNAVSISAYRALPNQPIERIELTNDSILVDSRGEKILIPTLGEVRKA